MTARGGSIVINEVSTGLMIGLFAVCCVGCVISCSRSCNTCSLRCVSIFLYHGGKVLSVGAKCIRSVVLHAIVFLWTCYGKAVCTKWRI